MTGVMATMSRVFPLRRDNLATLDVMSGSVPNGACAPSARKDSLPTADNSCNGGVREGISTRSSKCQQEEQVAIDQSGVPIFNPFTKLPPRIFIRPKEKQECRTDSEEKNLVSQCQSVVRSAFFIGFTHRTHLSPMHGGCTACPSAGSEECAPSGVLSPVAGVRAAADVPRDAAPSDCRRALLRGTSSVRMSSPIKICDEQGRSWAPDCNSISPLKQLHNFPLTRFLLCKSSSEGSSSLERESYVGEEIPSNPTRSARGCSIGLVVRTAARPVCASAHCKVTGGRINNDSVTRHLRHWTINRFTQQVLLIVSLCTLFCSTPHVLPRGDLAVTRTSRTRTGRSEAVVFARAQPAGFHYSNVEEPHRPQFEPPNPYYGEGSHEPHGALRASDLDGGFRLSSSFPQQAFNVPISHLTSPPQQQVYSPQTTAAQQYADQFLSSIREHYLDNLANSHSLDPLAAQVQQQRLRPEEQLEYAARFHLAQQQQYRTNPVDSFEVHGNAAPQQNRAHHPNHPRHVDHPFMHSAPHVDIPLEQPRPEQQIHVPQPHYLDQEQNATSGFQHSSLQLQYPAEEGYTQVQQQNTGYFLGTPQPHQSLDFLGAAPGTNYASPQRRVHFQRAPDFESAGQQNSSDLQYTEYVDRNFGGAVQQAYMPVDHSQLSHEYSQRPERGPHDSYVQHIPIEQLRISEHASTPEPQQDNEYVYVPHQRYIPGVLEHSEVSDYTPEPSPTYFQDYAPSSDQIDFSLQQALQQEYIPVDRHIAPVQLKGSQARVATGQQRDVEYDYIQPHHTGEAFVREQRHSLRQPGSAPVQQQFPRHINFGGNPVQQQFPPQINLNFEGNSVQQQYTRHVEELDIEGNPYHEPFSTGEFNIEEISYRRPDHRPDVPRVTEQQFQHEGTRQPQPTKQRTTPPYLRAGFPDELPTGKDAKLQTIGETVTSAHSYGSKPAQQTLRPQSEFQARGYRPTEELYAPGESQRRSTAQRRLAQSKNQQSTTGVAPSAESEQGQNGGREPLHEDEPELAAPEDKESYSQTQEANKAEAGPQLQIGTAEQDLTTQQPGAPQRVTPPQASDHFVDAEEPPQNEADQISQQPENKQHQQPRTITPKDIGVAEVLEENVKELEQLLDKTPFREEVTWEEETEDDTEEEEESEEVEADNSTSAELQEIEAKPEGGEQEQVEPEQKGKEVEAHDTTSIAPQEIVAKPEGGKSQQFESEQEGEEVETHQSTSAGLHEVDAKPEGQKQQQLEAGSTNVELILADDRYQESGDGKFTSSGVHALDVPETGIDAISEQDGQLERAASKEQVEQETETPLLSSPGANHPAKSPPERTGGAVARRLSAAPEHFDYYAALNQQERQHYLEPSRLPLKRQDNIAGEPENLQGYRRRSDRAPKVSARKEDTQGNKKYGDVSQNEAEDDDSIDEDTDSETQGNDDEEQDTNPGAHADIHPLIGKRDYRDAPRETITEFDDESEATETEDEDVDDEEEDRRGSSKPLQEIPGHLSTLSEDKGEVRKEITSKAASLTGQGTEAEVGGVAEKARTSHEGVDTLEKKAADTVTLTEPSLSKANGDAQGVGSIIGDKPRGERGAASEKARPEAGSTLDEEGEKSAVITKEVGAKSEAPTQKGDMHDEDVRETDPLVDQKEDTGKVATLEDAPVTDLKGVHGENGQGNQNSEEKQERLNYSALGDGTSPEQVVHETDKQHEEGKHVRTGTAQPEDDIPENKLTGEEDIGKKGQGTEKPEHPQAEYDAEKLGVSSQESEEKAGVDAGPKPNEQQRPAQNQDGELGGEQPQDFQPFELQTATDVSQEPSRGSIQSDAVTASGGHTIPQDKAQHQEERGTEEKEYPLMIAEGHSSDNVHLADKEHQNEEERVTSEEGLKEKSQASKGAQQAPLATKEEEQADRIHGNDAVVAQRTAVQDDKELAAEGPESGKPVEKGEPVEPVDTVRNTEDAALRQPLNTLSGVQEPQAEKQELAAKEREEASAPTGNLDAAKEAALEQPIRTPAELGEGGEEATVQRVSRSDEGEISPAGGVEAALDQSRRQPNSRRGVQAVEGAQEEAKEGDEVKEAVADAQAQLDGDGSTGPVTEEAKKEEHERTRAFAETPLEAPTDIGAQNNSEKASLLPQETVGRVEELNEPRSGGEPGATFLKSPPENAKAEETGSYSSPEEAQNAVARQFLPEEKRSFDPFFVGHGKADTTPLIHNKEVAQIPLFDSLPSHTAGETTAPGAVLSRRNSPLSWALKEAHISTDKEGRARKTERNSVSEEGSESDDRDYAFFPSAVRRRIRVRGKTEDRATGAHLLPQVPGLLFPANDLPPPPKVDSEADKTELTTDEDPSEHTNIDHDEKSSNVQPEGQKLDDRELKTPFTSNLKLYRDKVDHDEDDALFGSNDGALDPIAFSTLPPGATGRRRRRDHKKHSEKLAKAVRKQEQLVKEAVNAQQGKQADVSREPDSSAPDVSLAEQKWGALEDLAEEAKERETDEVDKAHGSSPVFRSTLAYQAAKAAAAGNEDDKDAVPYLLLPRQSERIAAAEVTTATGDPAEELSATQTDDDPLVSEKDAAEQYPLHQQAGPMMGPGPAAFVPRVIYPSPEEQLTLSTGPILLDPSLQDMSVDLIPAVDEPVGAGAEESVKEPETPSDEGEPQEAAKPVEAAEIVAEPDIQIPEYEEPVSPAAALASSRLASTLSQQMEAAEQAPTRHKLRGLEIPKSVQGKQNGEGIERSEDQETFEEVDGAPDEGLEESALATKVDYHSHTSAWPLGAEAQAINKLPKKSAAYTIFSISQAALSGPLLVAGWLLLSCW